MAKGHQSGIAAALRGIFGAGGGSTRGPNRDKKKTLTSRFANTQFGRTRGGPTRPSAGPTSVQVTPKRRGIQTSPLGAPSRTGRAKKRNSTFGKAGKDR